MPGYRHRVPNGLPRLYSSIRLTYDDAGGSLTVTGTNATVTTAGVALFDSDQFTVTSGLVSLEVVDGGTY